MTREMTFRSVSVLLKILKILVAKWGSIKLGHCNNEVKLSLIFYLSKNNKIHTLPFIHRANCLLLTVKAKSTI